MTFLENRVSKLTPSALFYRRGSTKAHKSENAGPSIVRRKVSPFQRIMSAPRPQNPTQHRTLFLSDVHLGTPGCKADLLLDFLRNNEAETLFLVGDIIDGWRIKRSWFWQESHNAVVQEVLHKVRHGTKVIYVPGNHDEALRNYTGLDIAGIDVCDEVIHTTADGKKLLVLHGDQFDSVVRYAAWLAHLGDRAYGIALALNNWLHVARRAMGMPYWSLSSYLKQKVKNAVEYISSFEVAVAREARERGVDGVVCGHIHHAEMRSIDGTLYCNDGDWVESCTAVAEDETGALKILHWHRFSWEENEDAAIDSDELVTIGEPSMEPSKAA
jgi:UDP-2,3-diacylglucosamine pyrophosphatase LpxH